MTDNLVIRTVDERDIPSVISLMKRSLGEKLVPKSEELFRWKHLQNPFGSSKLLLAESGNQIIGFRAFMFWNWEKGNQKIKAVRAVDTATDPGYQGKGIFRKLTMTAVDECIHCNTDMVFNTPNPISQQGYLKMGWLNAGGLPIIIRPGSLFPKRHDGQVVAELLNEYSIARLLNNISEGWLPVAHEQKYHTPLSIPYIRWRFQDCPVVSYGMIGDGLNSGMIFRIKKRNKLIELRICESWLSNNPESRKKLKSDYRRLVRKLGPVIVTGSSSVYFKSDDFFTVPLAFIKRGPMVTIRTLALKDLTPFINFRDWIPSAGALELF